ncbi:two-partner secretion domain-containing protein [Paraburkholderia tropica]|uniref:two-partner secretion domain-containing protein n=1 Tax=Paraburkholderia tropica TaxID=92647 RepID=UPI002ABD95C0|nr:filamentous hemagglutinin N-terminal domain-containing protein [Paraburkholderia tropica]
MRATAAIMTVVMYFTPAMLLADQAAHAAPPIVDPRAPVQFQPTITQTGAGVPAVNITAPNAAGLSVNQYSSFGVDAGTGLVLNNSLVSGTPLLGGALRANPNLAGRTATTILNQVTSTAPAILAGPLEVFGSPASVIVAAPNGVSVSGLSLTNAPGLVLTTGVPQFITGPGGAAASFANAGAVAFAVSSGNVSIHGAPGSTGANGPGAGIEGTVGNIDLIGQSVSLNAPLYANQAVNVVTGNQTVTPTPGSTGSAYWTSNVVAGQPGAVAVDASAFGSVTAGQVFIVSTAAGQGVNLQGPLAATAGNVSVSAAGDIVVGKTFGSENVTLASGGNVSINDTGLANQNYTVTATGDIKASGSVAGAKDVSLTAGHDLDVASVAANGQASLVAANSMTIGSLAANAIALDAKGGDLTINQGLTAPGVISANAGRDLTLSALGSITNVSDATNLAVLFSANGQAVLSAQGDIVNDNARIIANGAVSLSAQGDVRNVIDHAGGVNGGAPLAYLYTGGRFLFFRHQTGGYDVDYGTVTQPAQMAYIASSNGSVSISGRNVTNAGGIIQSSDGDVSIEARDTFTNAAIFAGQASYSRSCFIFCHGSASSSVTPYGGTIRSGGDVAIHAGESAANVGGNVIAQGNILVDAPLAYATGVTGYSAINQDRGFKAFFGSTWAQLVAMDIGGGLTADGLVTLTGDTLINGGYISGGRGVLGHMTTLRAPSRTPVQIGQHLGLTTWWWY